MHPTGGLMAVEDPSLLVRIVQDAPEHTQCRPVVLIAIRKIFHPLGTLYVVHQCSYLHPDVLIKVRVADLVDKARDVAKGERAT